MPNDRNPFPDDYPAQEPANIANLPAVSANDADDDDGIFINWPGFDPDDHPSTEEIDPDEADASDADSMQIPLGKQKKKRTGSKKEKAPKKQKRTPNTASSEDAEAEDDYAFQRAADSDIEESKGKRRRRKNDEEDNEAALSSIKYYKHTAKLKEIFLRRFLPITLALLFCIGFVLYFFRLQSLIFVNLRGYDAEDVFRAIHVRKNQFIFTVHDTDIEKRLRADFPYIKEVEVERTLPDTVHLIFTEDSARFYTKIYDEYFVISQSMRVLARHNSTEELDSGLREITLPSVSYAVVGHPLRFFDVSYLPFLSSFLDVIEESAVYRSVASMDLSNRFDIILNYEDRLKIELGDDENLETRLLFIQSTIETLDADERGTLHIVDNKQAIFSPEARTTD